MGRAISGQPTRKYHWFKSDHCHEVNNISSKLLITCVQQSNFHLLFSSLNLVHTSIIDVTTGVALTSFVRIGEACGLDWENEGELNRGPQLIFASFASLPCRPASHQQSRWSQSGQQGGAVMPGGQHCPSLDTQSGRDLELCCEKIKVQYI